MRKLLSCFAIVIVMMSFSTLAEHLEKGTEYADLNAAIKAFDHAYANNDVEKYFSFYADDATVYFSDARQDIAAYHQMWARFMTAGGGVELNEASDVRVQVMPSGNVAIQTSFIDNRTRSPDGKWKVVNLHHSGISEKE
jgi:ketosteroid isomerase-like protein